MPDPITQCVKQLRQSIQESQQQFAARLGAAIRTVARYETTRPPRGKALAQLEQIAREHGFDELAAVFHQALAAELGVDAPLKEVRRPFAFQFAPMALPVTTEEQELVAAVLLVMREKSFKTQRPRLSKLLAPALKEVHERLQPLNHVARIAAAYRRLLQEGKSPSVIAARLKVPKAQLEFIANMIEQTVTGSLPPPLAELALNTASVRDVARRYNLSEEELRAAQGYIKRIGLDPSQIPNLQALGMTMMG